MDDRTPGYDEPRPRRANPSAQSFGVGLPGYVRAEQNRRTIRGAYVKLVSRVVAGGYVMFAIQAVASGHRPAWFVALMTVPFLFAWMQMWD